MKGKWQIVLVALMFSCLFKSLIKNGPLFRDVVLQRSNAYMYVVLHSLQGWFGERRKREWQNGCLPLISSPNEKDGRLSMSSISLGGNLLLLTDVDCIPPWEC